ncbi:non-ribosomal peptide synthetase [Streptomyces albofaciens]|uniref:non-ribosomal peptide synthetase n=1 Tax=Streptomyces albofaciens TaxID=66866 RepID=UPI00142F1BB1|nr:non-ribosomal peptide synthetase [Streptomyces albofaciens]
MTGGGRAGEEPGTGAVALFRQWARAVPGRAALVHPGGRLTYAELDGRARALAAEPALAAVRPGDIVGVTMERSPLLPVAVLALWAAGGAYVPLPASYPAARNRAVLHEAGVRTVLTDREPDPAVLSGPTGDPVTCVRLTDRILRASARPPAQAVPPVPAARPDHAAGPEDLAYVLHTSGSSGAPKGVRIPHRAVVNLAHGLQHVYGDLAGARVLQFAPFTFDVWIWELAMSLLSGGTLVVPRADVPLHGPELGRILRESDISHLSGAASLVATLPEEEPIPVTTLTSGGEPLPEYLVRRWGGRLRLFNAYGPTEAGVCATMGRCRPGQGTPGIGHPLPGVSVHLLDERGTAVPDGEPGEVYIGGPGVGLGYLDRPADTRRHFVPDRFTADRPGRLLYRTGDLARRLPDGSYLFLGRIDAQLNVRGYRIEPGEVEAALLRHPDVTAAAVTATRGAPDGSVPPPDRDGPPSAGGTDRLTAHVQAAPGATLTGAALRRHLAALLPAHLVPSSFVLVDRLPLTAHGKIDRTALVPPAVRRCAPPAGRNTTASGRERDMAELVATVLGLDEVAPDDDFADLGATSLDLIRIQAAVTARWNTRLGAADLMDARTVRRLAALLDRTRNGARGAGTAPPGAARAPGHPLPAVRTVKGGFK